MVADKAHTIAEMKAAKAEIEADFKNRLNDFAVKFGVEVTAVDLELHDTRKFGSSLKRVIESVKVNASI